MFTRKGKKIEEVENFCYLGSVVIDWVEARRI